MHFSTITHLYTHYRVQRVNQILAKRMERPGRIHVGRLIGHLCVLSVRERLRDDQTGQTPGLHQIRPLQAGRHVRVVLAHCRYVARVDSAWRKYVCPRKYTHRSENNENSNVCTCMYFWANSLLTKNREDAS